MVATLKRVCILAIWAAGLPGVSASINCVSGNVMQTTVKMLVPIRLKSRWMTVVRFALRPVPIEASTAVMQVPMFWPKRT